MPLQNDSTAPIFVYMYAPVIVYVYTPVYAIPPVHAYAMQSQCDARGA